MQFKEFKPGRFLSDLVENYWIVRSNSHVTFEQKVIPDGYPEIIFHYGDLYEIKLRSTWQKQSRFLFSGQISNHFYLRNTGKINILGIKLKPTAPSRLFKLNMASYTDSVTDATLMPSHEIALLEHKLRPIDTKNFVPELVDEFFNTLFTSQQLKQNKIDLIVSQIINTNGQLSIEELAHNFVISRRSLERTFLNTVGISPKYFSRIIRFNAIFKMIKEKDPSWCQLAFDSGFYDQAHFIKEFKSFSGELPTQYGFDENTFANFFLNR